MSAHHDAVLHHAQARTALRLRLLAAARPVRDFRSDATLFPNYLGQTYYYYSALQS